MEEQTPTPDTAPAPPVKRGRGRPPGRRATMPATDAADSDMPIRLTPGAYEGTRDRLKAFEWMEAGEHVVRRDDGLYERLQAPPAPKVVEPETFEFYPDVELLDRRLLEPSLQGELGIRFRDEGGIGPNQEPKYYKRWVDTFRPSRLLTLTQRGGYMQAKWSMLANESDVADRHKSGADEYVRRGEKGQYMLVFMPYNRWKQIKMRQTLIRTDKERNDMKRLAASRAQKSSRDGGLGSGVAGDQIDSMFTGRVTELPPQTLQAFQTSALPKDLGAGGGERLEDS